MASLTRLEPDWTIRPLRASEVPAARRLIEAVWHEHFHDHPNAFVRNFIYSRLSDVDNAETVYADRALFLCAIAVMIVPQIPLGLWLAIVSGKTKFSAFSCNAL